MPAEIDAGISFKANKTFFAAAAVALLIAQAPAAAAACWCLGSTEKILQRIELRLRLC